MVRKIIDLYGNEYASMLDSWNIWRKKTNNFQTVRNIVGEKGLISGDAFISASDGSVCPYCHRSQSMFYYSNEWWGKPYLAGEYCLCDVLDFQVEVDRTTKIYQSPITNSSLSGLAIEHPTIKQATDAAKRFIESQPKWLVLIGTNGCGKSHILHSITRELWPMVLYVTASKFEDMLYTTTKNETLSEYVNTLKNAPILIIDDWGMEYGKGYVQAKFRDIIDHRYTLWKERPIAWASNLSLEDARMKDPFIGSRLSDLEKVERVTIKAQDYRPRNSKIS